MARKTERVVVDGQTFQITQLELEDGLEVYSELARVAGSSLNSLPSGADEAALLGLIVRAIGDVPLEFKKRLGKLFAAQSRVVTMAGTTELLVEMNDVIYKDTFAGELGKWTRWIIACLRLNFSDFLPQSASASSPEKTAATS